MNETNIIPIRTEQGSSRKDLLLWLFTNLLTAKIISISKRTVQRPKEGNQSDFHYVIFEEVFTKITGKKAKTGFLLHTKLSFLLKCFQNTI